MLAGVDRFLRAGGARGAQQRARLRRRSASTSIPTSSCSATSEDRLVLAAPNAADGWMFTCDGSRARRSRNRSIFAGLGGPRRSRQIVLSFKASEVPEVHWQLTRTHIMDYPQKS